MFSKSRITLTIIVLGLLIGTGLKAHNLLIHSGKKPDLSFTSEPKISCNIDGKTFERETVADSSGNTLRFHFSPSPLKPVVSIKAETHGLGWAHTLFHGKIDGVAFGDKKNYRNKQLGKWLTFAPFWRKLDNTIEYKEYGFFDGKGVPKTYKWEGKGTITLVPYYWKDNLSGFVPGGSWQKEDDKRFHKEKSADVNGSWELKEFIIIAPDFSYNKTMFKVNETLEVTVKQQGLYSASLFVGNEFVTTVKANGSSGSVVLPKTFGNGDVGTQTVKVVVRYVGPKGKTRYFLPFHHSMVNVRAGSGSGSGSTTTVPSKPQNFSASRGGARCSVLLTWEAPESNGGSSIEYYEYRYQTRSGNNQSGSWTDWRSVGKRTSKLVTGLNSRGTYAFELRAVNKDREKGAISVSDPETITTR